MRHTNQEGECQIYCETNPKVWKVNPIMLETTDIMKDGLGPVVSKLTNLIPVLGSYLSSEESKGNVFVTKG